MSFYIDYSSRSIRISAAVLLADIDTDRQIGTMERQSTFYITAIEGRLEARANASSTIIREFINQADKLVGLA